jgi:HAD superfamily phosphatase (TIGR01668 family)
MLSIFVPDIYQKSIYDLNYKKLKRNGIKCLVFDLDNTLASVDTKVPKKKLKDLIEDLKEMGFKVLIVSNATKKRVEPFKDILCVDSSYLSMKPSKRKYQRILSLYKLKPSQIACVGDQLLTDVWGANRMEMTSILINPIGTLDFVATKLNRFLEGVIFRHLEKKDLLKRGNYYD